jgi:Carboxypeptidase regulatory-like domain
MRAGRFLLLVALGTLFLISVDVARADVYGKIRGIVTDPSGAVIPKAKVVAINTGTGINTTTVSGQDGSYEFLQLAAPAIYNITAETSGFKKVEVDGIHLELNQIFVENLQMQLGSVTETVSVSETAITQVETTSIELGTVINSTTIVNTPLEGRSFVDLMKTQPGVVEASDARGGSGFGNYSANGSQADQDSYLINGMDNNDLPLNEVQINVSPDAIAEFKMVTNTINPEYGRNSGAIINSTVKSGTNAFHGDAFDFYRDTTLNAKPFFQPTAQVFHQNLFGGTVGGPIWKDHTFFFFSYQGDRFRRPEDSGDCGCVSPGTSQVFTSGELNGVFPDLQTSTKVSPFPLVDDNGNTQPAGTPYSTIFSNGTIPTADINSISKTLLGFVPPAGAAGTFQFNPIVKGTDDQLLLRIDHSFNSRDSLWGYALWERFPTIEDLPFFGATLPGFGDQSKQHWQQYADAWDHTFGPTTLNEVTIGYTRFNYANVFPQNPVAPSSAGFTGIHPQLTTGEGLPVVVVNGPSVSTLNFQLGFSENGPQPRIDQTYQVGDSLTKIVGKHSLKFGFTMRRFEVFNPFAHLNDGAFTFAGTGAFSTGDAGADFLLGIPDSYQQASGDYLNERAQEYYSYIQDQWKIRPNLTVTIGTGWSIDTPMVDNAHGNHAGIAFRPGQQSTVFPNAPAGYVFQGDAGVNAFGTTKYKHFGPRVGLAYSPDWGWLTGGAGKTSIRAGYGIYYNRFNGETALQTQASPPFAQSSFGVGDIGGSPNFADPFTGYALSGTNTVTAVSEPNKFPYAPTANADFSALEPMSISVYDPNITVPNAQNYNLTIERQFGNSTLVSLGYVGSQGRHLLLAIELNPLILPPGCTPGSACVAAIAASFPFQPVAFPNDYKYPGNIFASIGNVTTSGTSNYNAFQATVNHNLSHGLQFLVSYTYSHALDLASGFENSGFAGGGFGGFGNTRSTNPFNPHLDYGDSNYDARHRLVISYTYYLPSIRHFHAFQWIPSRVTEGWNISGITTFQSGFPLDIVDGAFPSLGASFLTFYSTPGQSGGWDAPNLVGPIQYVNPRTPMVVAPNTTAANYWFDPTPSPVGCAPGTPPCVQGAFSAPTIGTQGNAGRDIIHGPGRNNFDFALMKDTRITERTKVELRFEFYNFFNHTQFDPNGINTNFNSSAFGTETAAFAPRTIQLAAKMFF